MRFNSYTGQLATGAVAFPAATSITGGLKVGNGMVNNSPFSSSGGWVLVTVSLNSANAIAVDNGTLSAANGYIQPGQLITSSTMHMVFM